MNVTKERKLNLDNKLFLLVFIITLTVFVFTNDGHRYTLDEDVAEQQSMRIVTQMPDPTYVQGQSRIFFEYPDLYPPELNLRPICQNAILCSQGNIGHSLTQVPLILINHNFHIITDKIRWTTEDFNDPHYVWWRNSLNPDFTFLELFYGPIFSALSVGIFFLVCRTFDFTPKTSITLALLYGFTTITWAYSKTSLSSVPMTFFVLLGFLFFRKFRGNQSSINLIYCATSFGFAFLVRPDTIFFIAPLFLLILYELRKQNGKVKKFFSFVIPVTSAYLIDKIINFARFGFSSTTSVGVPAASNYNLSQLGVGQIGLLLSPGIGLLFFAPILFMIFLSFPDFYRTHKLECILFLSFIAMFLIFYGTLEFWHGLNAWGPRYLLPVVPFLLLPLGASIEKRKNRIFKILSVILGGFGVIVNLVYMVQDVSWFVWGVAGGNTGLYALGMPGMHKIWIDPVVIWTFHYSQLTQAILFAFTDLQPDIFLLKVLTPQYFVIIFSVIVIPQIYFLYHLLYNKSHFLHITKH